MAVTSRRKGSRDQTKEVKHTGDAQDLTKHLGTEEESYHG
jgi:hypothetical protein